MTDVKECKHCGGQIATSGPCRGNRNLCLACWSDPAIRQHYPRRSAGPGLGNGPCKGSRRYWLPTDALPGTEDKLMVFQERALLNLPLFHPRDRKLDEVGAGVLVSVEMNFLFF